MLCYLPHRNLEVCNVPDSAIELTGFSVHRSDRTKELTGKSRGGGVCFYINNSWCDERNIHSIKSFCSPDLEFHTLLCRPFWLPREFRAIIITAVYIPPPKANTDQALRELYGNISRAVVKSTFVESKTSPSPKRFESESSPSPKRFESESSPSPKWFESKSKWDGQNRERKKSSSKPHT